MPIAGLEETQMTTVAPCTAFFKAGLKSLFKPAAIFPAIFLALIIYFSSPLAAAAATPNPAGFDILGMKLGMSVAQIEAAIRAYSPTLQMTTFKVPINQRLGVGKFVLGVNAERRIPGAAPTELIWVRFTVAQPGRAFYIGRVTQFPPQQQPLPDKTTQQLGEKYGPESKAEIGADFRSIDWVFDTAGKQLFPKTRTQRSQVCAGPFSYGIAFQVGGFDNVTKTSYSQKCGIDLAADLDIQPSSNTPLVRVLSEQLVGISIAVDDIQKLMADANTVQERQRQLQEQKASGVKPSL
jgi:hypothetical protein